MIVCYHPDCLKSRAGPVVRLKHPFYLKTYHTHLGRHCDMLGDGMKKRFGAIDEDLFMTHHALDEVFQSPYSLQPNLKLNSTAVDAMQKYGITRELKMNYVCHWKNWLIEQQILNVDSLSFQEDEAFIHCVLSYPRPVHEWKLWKTVFIWTKSYDINIFCSIKFIQELLIHYLTIIHINRKMLQSLFLQ